MVADGGGGGGGQVSQRRQPYRKQSVGIAFGVDLARDARVVEPPGPPKL